MYNYKNLIGDIYDAALNPHIWPNVIEQVANYCDGERVMLATTDILHPHSNFQYTYNIPEEAIAAWRAGTDEQEVELHNQWIESVPPGTVINSDDYFGSPENFLVAGKGFVAILNQYGIRRQMVVMFERDNFRLFGVGLNNYAPFQDYSNKRLQEVSPHLRRSINIHRQLSSLQQQNNDLYKVLEMVPAGVVLLDMNRRVRYTTENARKMIIENGSLLIRQSELYLRDTNVNNQLKLYLTEAIRVSLRERFIQAGGVISIKGDTGVNLLLTIVPLSAMEIYKDLYSDKIAAAIFISVLGAKVELPLLALASLYNLTPRELQMCQEFVNIVDLRQVAVKLGIKYSSIRSLLKRIYYKTGQNSQAGLMKILVEARVNFRHI